MSILITGNLGYIGSVLAPRLAALCHDVAGLDCGYFRDCIVGQVSGDVQTLARDVRDVLPQDVVGSDAIVHLAGLANDHLGELAPGLTEDINYRATMRLAELARDAGVRRFIYSSSPSMCGISTSDSELDDDESEKAPVTSYVRIK